MDKNLTEVVVVLDRSGSMQSCLADAIGGLNAFIDEQKKGVGDVNFTLVQFDDNYEVVLRGVPIKNVGEQKLVPRGGTALLDAVGKAIVETGERLALVPENERPGLVVFVIITDGGENASREYTKTRVKEMITEQTNVYNWQFQFLGSNQDGFKEGTSLGIGASYTFAPRNTLEVFTAGSKSLHRMRAASSVGEEIVSRYTEEEQESLVH